jgi:hypothetical protein
MLRRTLGIRGPIRVAIREWTRETRGPMNRVTTGIRMRGMTPVSLTGPHKTQRTPGSTGVRRTMGIRALVRFAPGEYRLPTAEGSYTGRLPVCAQIADIGPPLELGPAGNIWVSVWGEYSSVGYEQAMYDELGQEWTLRMSFGGTAGVVRLQSASLVSGDRRLNLISNAPHEWYVYDYSRHKVTFTRGYLHSEFISSWGGTPSSGIIYRAEGELDGVVFEQDDYWRLTNNFYHHFFGADWAVFFDSPIGSACGIMVINGEPVGLGWEWPDPTVSTILCDFTVDQEHQFVSTEGEQLNEFPLPCPDLHP